jgi:hypothetical protein
MALEFDAVAHALYRKVGFADPSARVTERFG